MHVVMNLDTNKTMIKNDLAGKKKILFCCHKLF